MMLVIVLKNVAILHFVRQMFPAGVLGDDLTLVRFM